uniref:FAT atypical cadherin 1a n=1 Tax=Hippocampus comes TaxID=109280 RepID=A0A3Q3D844_HIPCM
MLHSCSAYFCRDENCKIILSVNSTMTGRQALSLASLLLQLVWTAGAASLHFTQPVYNGTIYENSAAKTYLESHIKMGIYVTDPAWEIRYKIISGDNENLFKAEDYLLGDFSFLRIRTKGGSTAILNREVRDHYVLTVKASERGTDAECRAQVRVQVLDTNDLRPLFSPTSYSISLPENTAIRGSVAKVTATDADIGTNGEYYYSFREWTDMFAVHPTSGVVTLTGRLDYSETKLYELEILAVDRGMKLYGSSGFSSTARLTVRVEQANENAPVVTAVTLTPSDANPDPTYAIVTVEDSDLGPNGEIASLSIVAGDPLQQFRAVRTSPGSKEYKIKAVKNVDWESQPFGYNLTLQAKDKGSPPQFSSAKLVHVTSPQFKTGPPVFEKAVYRVNLSEFAPVHTPVVMVTALPKHPRLKYAFSHKSDRFTINPDTGLISTAAPISANAAVRFELDVTASGGKAATKVIVDVIDVNNNAPEFQQTSYRAGVDENAPVGTSVVTVKAVDLDRGENGYVTYSITNINPQPFVIDYFSGVISTSELLDYELMPRIYSLKVRASDWGSPFRREVEAVVTVTLNNLNDNQPLFENVDCDVTVPRDHGVGEQITTVSAIDADELQLVRYYIKSGDDLDLFELNSNSGVLSLRNTLSEGEAAKRSFHSLRIVASDGERETQPMYMNITVITARMPVQVKCVETGVATMLAEKLLQGSKVHTPAEPDDHFVDIHSINRYAPRFAESFPASVEVREDLPVGGRIAHLGATDADSGFNGKLVYVISGGDAESRFLAEMETGWLLVYSPLDRETKDHYTLNVTVYDLGIPQKSSSRLLDVKISDANDNIPRFLQESYSVEISESTPVGTEIIQVDSTDKDQGENGVVRYSILGGTDHFAINAESGVVTVAKPLDRELRPVYDLKIAARDLAEKEPQLVSAVPLKITLEDVNDNPPKFVPPNYRIKVREDLPVGTVVMWLEAHDPDVGPSSQIRYGLMDNGDGNFEVDKLSGAVRIVQNLDYETKQVYNLTAKAKDKGKPVSLSSTCFVEVDVVDVNENLYRPVFRSFVEKGFIKEDAVVGSSVMTVRAEDEDKGRDGEIRYSIRDGSGLGIFTIDEETGESFCVSRQLGVWNTQASVWDDWRVLIRVIDTNNHRPQFSRAKYEVSVPEDVPVGTEVLHVDATDQDEKNKLTFTLLSSTDPFSLKKFKLDPGTGRLYTAEPLDHETMHSHVLTVMVRDQDIPVKRNLVRVIVNVEDANDNAPWFVGTPYSGRVFESAAVGSAVLQVTALDKDKGRNAEVVYSIESGNVANSFAVDPVLGTVTVAKELSRSGKTRFELTVKATDRGAAPLSTTAAVSIAVTVSDNAAPRFSEKVFSADISESAALGSFVSSLAAVSQSSVFYQIKSGNTDNAFDINPNSGVVVTQKELDYEVAPQYKLVVQGTNMAGLASNATLVIHLKDENDNAPIFLQREFEGVVSESAAINSVVLTRENAPFVIRASDADSDRNAMLVYQIVEPFALNYFAVDSSTGAVRITTTLDHEQRSVYRFTVQVHDLGVPRLFAEMAANVTIKVIDVNDCPPVFSQDVYEATVVLPTYRGVEVVKVNATDLDSRPNARLLFSISEGNIGDKFKMDANTGVIFIQNVTQLRSRYELKVRVSDGRFANVAAVKIHLKENKASKVKFTRESYRASVPENLSERRTLEVIAAVGNHVNEPLFYKILNPDKRFEIGRTSGVVSTTGIAFDREKEDTFDVVVEVTKEDPSEDTAHVVLTVAVEDVNDNAPVFVNLPYRALVQMDAEEGQVVRQVTAVDKDRGRNAEIRYELKESHEHFDINPSGEITIKKTLEKESLDMDFVVIVVAMDGGDAVLSSEVEVPITVVNQAVPIFEKPFYNIEIPENIQVHTPVLHVQASDSEGPRIVYTISEGDPFKQFSIDFNTGVLHVAQPLDFETHPAYKLNIRATDSLTGAHSDVFVDIILEDINDNSPVFLSKSYYATISEASVIGTSVLQVEAKDFDTGHNQEIFYQLVEEKGKSSNYFAIDRDTGLISTARVLDHEDAPQHHLRVRAVDGGVPALFGDVLVTVDITDLNDNAPMFAEPAYKAAISELASRGHFVTQVQASDADSSDSDKLEFAIVSGNDDQSFAIDKQTGAIVISNHRLPQMQPLYHLNVSVSDGVYRSSALVDVTVIGANFHNPAFSQVEYAVELVENSPAGTMVAEAKATDDDDGIYGQITYRIVNDVAKDKFTVNENGDVFTLESLDRDSSIEKVIPISLEAKDGGGKVGFCTVNVVLTDVNDNAPQFRAAEYKVTIASDAPRGTSVVKIAASDVDEGTNADVEYSIEADVENVAENFEIHRTSGVILTRESLIGLEGELYAFFVRAKDTGNPPKHSVVQVYIRIVTPETPIPKFAEPHYRYTVAEDLPIGTEIDVLPAESEQQLTYTLVNGNTPESNENEVFIVDGDTGALKLQKSLDHETTKWYQLTLRAQAQRDDFDIVASVSINIQVKDLNDNEPVFESDPYQAVVVENLPGGAQVVQVKATDLDSGTNGLVLYSLDAKLNSQDIVELFAINAETGWLTTLKELDREKRNEYTIAVIATDQGDKVQHATGTRVEVTVADVNDNPPRFTAEVYKGTVSEDDPPPSGVIAILSTTDEDSEDINRQVNYFITAGDPLGQFAIEHIQNEWKVSVRKPLDRETTDYYLLNVTASDGIFTTKAVVEVKVLDANDNSPVCEKSLYSESVPENSPASRLILQVSATDADIRSNAQISYELNGPGSELFFIDSETGELKTLKPLDREECDEYRFKVRAVDGAGRFCEANVHVSVRDVNDNAPEFAADPYAITVFENTETGTFVAKLQADDADSGLNGDVVYSLLDSADGWFAIDELSGIISLERPLDREARALYELEARAAETQYAAAVPEDAAVGGQVLRVQAASRDVEASGEIAYSIVSGNEHGAFSVDPSTGDIFVIAPLEYELSHEFYITVEATDGGSPPLSDMATVNINVTEVNDNAPVFSQRVYAAVVGEDAELGCLTGNDTGRRTTACATPSWTATADPIRGELKVARQLDREQTSGYTLTVLAVDSGTPPLSGSAVVNVDISDVNDNPPLFSQANYSLIIQENQAQGTSVLQLLVSDRDASHNGPPFAFSIAGGDAAHAFHIDPHGALLLAGPLSKRAKEHYLLQAQVSDSGKPALTSSAFISVRVIEESVYPPAILPLDIFVSTADDEYAGGVLGKIHATDQDVYDTLTYSLAPSSAAASASFSVSASDGKVIALRPLDPGHYPLNVTVTDGRFTAAADVNVHVRQAARQALDNSIAVRFASIAPEEFIGDYWRNFQRALRNIAGVRRNDVQLVSLQPSEQGDLDVLLALERSGSPYQSQELNSSAGVIEEMTGVRIVRVAQKLCSGMDCPLRFCDEVVSLDRTSMSTYSTARLSFVTPRHHRHASCQCQGGNCPVLNSVCDNSPCPEGLDCAADAHRDTKYTCVCPQGTTSKCTDGHSLTFSGSGYVKYHLMENDNKEQMKLSMRLRTFSGHATVMFAKGTDYSILEIVNGRLQYKFDCGSGPGLVSVHSATVNDGEWHSVSLEVDGNYAKLVLDRVHAASGTAPGTLRTLNLDNSVYFGGHVRQHAASAARLGRNLPVANGFRGCMEAIALNGQELPLNTKARRAHAVMEAIEDVAPGCALTPPESCSSNPCSNGGVCTPRPSGGYFCKCPASFMGAHCEMAISPCASNPCLYGGTCVPRGDDFYCQCRGQYSGQRCQMGPFCTDNPCKNNGKCIDSLDGPVCECEAGFHGDRCLSDVDECSRSPCSNGGQCHNTYGSYKCNCSLGFAGPTCELAADVRNDFVSTSWNIGLEEVVGIVIFVSSIFILVLFFVILRKKACRAKSKTEDDDKRGGSGVPHSFLQRPYFDAKFNKNVYSDIPPQVPVRPISYTPSIPSDSRNNLDRNSFEGSAIPEHPEFSTFNPDAVHGHRKTVAVCSVAPNLPPPPPSNSVSDSDSIQKPSWDYDYDGEFGGHRCHAGCTHHQNFHASVFFFPPSHTGYHWDTSDWMPSVQLPGIKEFPQYELVESPPTTLYSDPSAMDTDYYPGGYDIESDFPPPPDDFPSGDELPPPPPEYGDTLRSATTDGIRRRPALPELYSLGQYLAPRGDGDSAPPSSTAATADFPPGRDFDDMSLSLYASTASCSDMSACCEESEAMISDYESGDDSHFDCLSIPPLGSQQHTEV